MTHTPTPWHLDLDPDGEYTIRGARDEWISNNTSYFPSAPNFDDAEFIVKAVNAHDNLVEALRHLAECNLTNPHDFRQFARAALEGLE